MKSIKIEAERKTGEKRETIRGVQFLVSLSPYFFPESLEADYKEETGCLVINFKYLDNEPRVCASREHDLVTIWVGKHTGKLLSLHIRVDKHNIDRVQMSVIEQALKAVQENNPDMGENYEVAEKALRDHSQEISELIPA